MFYSKQLKKKTFYKNTQFKLMIIIITDYIYYILNVILNQNTSLTSRLWFSHQKHLLNKAPYVYNSSNTFITIAKIVCKTHLEHTS